jgi:hypothetical protein
MRLGIACLSALREAIPDTWKTSRERLKQNLCYRLKSDKYLGRLRACCVETMGLFCYRKNEIIGICHACLMMVMRGIFRSGVTSLPLRCPIAGVISSKEAGEALTGEPFTVRSRHAGCAH